MKRWVMHSKQVMLIWKKIIESDKYDNIIAFTVPANEKSIDLLKKLGLKYLGEFKKGKDTLAYFSLRDEITINQ